MEKCTELKEFVQQSEGLDAVIDFSSYHPQFMEDALKLLSDKARFYIYISTDSVYDVSVFFHWPSPLSS